VSFEVQEGVSDNLSWTVISGQSSPQSMDDSPEFGQGTLVLLFDALSSAERECTEKFHGEY